MLASSSDAMWRRRQWRALEILILEEWANCPNWRREILEKTLIETRHNWEMPRLSSSIEKIRAELAWVNEPVDPNVCGCRHLWCCEQTAHTAGKCPCSQRRRCGVSGRNIFCSECRTYHFGGNRVRGYMTAR
jgi:hypothetical protein